MWIKPIGDTAAAALAASAAPEERWFRNLSKGCKSQTRGCQRIGANPVWLSLQAIHFATRR
jgi:hypothetical protein